MKYYALNNTNKRRMNYYWLSPKKGTNNITYILTSSLGVFEGSTRLYLEICREHHEDDVSVPSTSRLAASLGKPFHDQKRTD